MSLQVDLEDGEEVVPDGTKGEKPTSLVNCWTSFWIESDEGGTDVDVGAVAVDGVLSVESVSAFEVVFEAGDCAGDAGSGFVAWRRLFGSGFMKV